MTCSGTACGIRWRWRAATLRFTGIGVPGPQRQSLRSLEELSVACCACCAELCRIMETRRTPGNNGETGGNRGKHGEEPPQSSYHQKILMGLSLAWVL